MDVSYVNPFITSTIETFNSMMSTKPVPGQPSLKQDNQPTYDVSGVIGLSGEALGNVVISFPKPVALKVISAMLGTEIKMMGPEITDGIGEIANIIAGNAKQGLTKYKIDISLPKVIIGTNHTVGTPSGVPAIVVPFKCSLGTFAMEISLKTK